ncbi:hypothetical protein OESDEN_05300 [Oesophagostomum dentatum]|uniref:Uncharacterized protein n=1 Tax=Oesophagostomum dentatum TaxID=61180 RepID=A0A0B1TBW8_OESDE|nr:hypothetical protein OESDEN_05300 [Oesophagostomum dentatum]
MLAFLLLLNVHVETTENDMELALVQVIWHHGDISPLETYENDPFQANWTFGGSGFGRLSPVSCKWPFLVNT